MQTFLGKTTITPIKEYKSKF